MARRWNDIRSGDGSLSEVNMTPLIDVSLVLVVILLLATPLAFESSFGLGRTHDNARPAAAEETTARIELDIVDDTIVRVNGRAVELPDLTLALRPLLREGDGQVAVSCADQVSHGTFVRVLDIAKYNGAMGIAVAGR